MQAVLAQPRVRFLAWLGAGLLCAALVVGVSVLAPHLTLSARPAFALAFLWVSAEILLLSTLAPPSRGPLWWATLLSMFATLGLLSGSRLTGESAGLVTAALLWTATGLGAALGARIDKPGHLTAVAAVSALADLWSVYDPAGPSAMLAQQVLAQPERVTAFALSFPLLGSTHIPALIGAGDVLFAALYIAGFERHALPRGRAMIGLGAGFLVGLVLLLTLERPLPLLPLLGGGIVLCDRRVRSLERRESRSVLLVLAVVSALLVARIWR